MLTIHGFGSVALARADETTNRVGDRGRAFSGASRSDTRAQFRTWSLTTATYPKADALSLRAALLAAEPVECSGDLFDQSGTVDCEVSNIRLRYVTGDDASVSFDLSESL